MAKWDDMNKPGEYVFFASLEKEYSKQSFSKVGDVGPYPSAEEASVAMDQVLASREGEQLLNLLDVDRIRIQQRIVQ
jgi:hypothetical protein